MNRTNKAVALAAAGVLAMLASRNMQAQSVQNSDLAHMQGQVDIDAKAREVAKSLVMVEYTLRNENGSSEEAGQGLVIDKRGVILVSGSMFPERIPVEWTKEIKVRLPLKDFTSVPAKFLGRTENRRFAFIKTEKPIEAPAFDPGEMAPAKLGESVFAVGMLGKTGGYAVSVGVSRVKIILELTQTIAATGSFGLTTATSPVFDVASGKLVGLTLPSEGDSMLLRVANKAAPIELVDPYQSSEFLPEDEIQDLFKDIPTKPFYVPQPWIAVDEITGVPEDVKALEKIEQPAAVTIGSVIPNEPADKAGLQAKDIILTVDGKEFSHSPVPDLMTMHFTRVIEKHKPGDVVTLGVLRDGKKMDVKVTLGTSPKSSGDMPHVYSDNVGVVTRDLVFADAYARKLPQDTKGVMVALVKNGAPASLGSTPLRAGYLITKVDDQAVDNQKDFLGAMKKLGQNKDAKEAVFVVIQPTGDTTVCHIDLTK